MNQPLTAVGPRRPAPHRALPVSAAPGLPRAGVRARVRPGGPEPVRGSVQARGVRGPVLARGAGPDDRLDDRPSAPRRIGATGRTAGRHAARSTAGRHAAHPVADTCAAR
jgi:hypothetical protein